MRAGELASLSGVSKDALRYYEREGLLPAPHRLMNGYRSYPPEALARVNLIRAAVSIGFTVAELAAILRCRDRGGSPCADVRRLAGEKLDRLTAEIRELKLLRSELHSVIADWDARITAAGPGKRAGLLDSLAAARIHRSERQSSTSERKKSMFKVKDVIRMSMVAVLLTGGALRADDSMHDCPMAAGSKSKHAEGVIERGDQGMGFDHAKTTHHFRLAPDGGAIEVTANSLADGASRDQIRLHLTHIAIMFAGGDFSVPMFVHDTIPPGVTAMKRLASAISYRFEEIAGGGRVVISTATDEGRDAVHDFLRFQITDHATGDPLEVVGAAEKK